MSEFAIYPSLNGKTVFFISGASRIVKRILRAFAARVAKVDFVDFNDAGSKMLIADLGEDHANWLGDLHDIGAQRGAIQKLAVQIGSAEFSMNNATRDAPRNRQGATPKYWNERMQTNPRHMFFLRSSPLPRNERGWG